MASDAAAQNSIAKTRSETASSEFSQTASKPSCSATKWRSMPRSGINTCVPSGENVTPCACGPSCRRAFGPEVFATDRALELVAGGMPFRDAYHEVKAHLGDLTGRSPDEALAAKRHLGAPMGLDLAALDARGREAEAWAAEEAAHHLAHRNRLLGLNVKNS